MEVLPTALTELKTLPSTWQREAALKLIVKLTNSGEDVDSEELARLPALQRFNNTNLAGVHRAVFDASPRWQGRPRYQVVFRFLPSRSDSRRSCLQIIAVGLRPSSPANLLGAVVEIAARLRQTPRSTAVADISRAQAARARSPRIVHHARRMVAQPTSAQRSSLAHSSQQRAAHTDRTR